MADRTGVSLLRNIADLSEQLCVRLQFGHGISAEEIEDLRRAVRSFREHERARAARGGKGGSALLPLPVSKPSELKDQNQQPPDRKNANWLQPYVDAWVRRFGGRPSWGQLGRALKALDAADPVECQRRWLIYLDSTDGRFVNPWRFVQTYGDWDAPKPRALATADRRDARPGESAEDYLQRLTR